MSYSGKLLSYSAMFLIYSGMLLRTATGRLYWSKITYSQLAIYSHNSFINDSS